MSLHDGITVGDFEQMHVTLKKMFFFLRGQGGVGCLKCGEYPARWVHICYFQCCIKRSSLKFWKRFFSCYRWKFGIWIMFIGSFFVNIRGSLLPIWSFLYSKQKNYKFFLYNTENIKCEFACIDKMLPAFQTT